MDKTLDNGPMKTVDPMDNSIKSAAEENAEAMAETQMGAGLNAAPPEAVREATGIAAPTSEDNGAASGPKREQLHRRVEERVGELEAALAQLDGQANEERARAIRTALESAQDHMSGGWEHVGEMEAAKLSHWLGTTADLRVASSNTDAGPAEPDARDVRPDEARRENASAEAQL